MQPVKLLIVDDNQADVLLMKRALQDGRIANEVYVAKDGVEAMQCLRREAPFDHTPRPDLVFLDLNMPRKSGDAVLKEIKSDPNLCSIPVIVLTTSDSFDDIQRSYADRANSFMTKPVDLQQFRAAILNLTNYWFSVVKLPPT